MSCLHYLIFLLTEWREAVTQQRPKKNKNNLLNIYPGSNCLHDNCMRKKSLTSKPKWGNCSQDADVTCILHTSDKTLKCNLSMMSNKNLTFYFNWQFVTTFLYITVPAHLASETNQIAQWFKPPPPLPSLQPTTILLLVIFVSQF